MYTIDFETKELAFLATVGGDGSILIGAPSTVDATNSIFYAQYIENITTTGPNIYAVQTRGTKRGTVTEINEDEGTQGQWLGTMDADDSGTLYGFGLQNNARAVISLDPQKEEYKMAAALPGYKIEEGSISAFDAKTRVLYGIMQPSNDVKYYTDATDCGSAGCAAGTSCCKEPMPGSQGCCFNVDDCSTLPVSGGFNTTDPFRILGVNVDTGDIVSDAPLCTEDEQNCPWALAAISE